ncbi:hypothetical protein BJ170DRAFT_207145 [Xylariales sp. AK1849]|nr:hypothetical protein BJ170DRAFT_207145 [Xylariales sp. AK1849]
MPTYGRRPWSWVLDPHAAFRKVFTWGFIGANGLIMLAWRAASEQAGQGRMRSIIFLQDNFLLNFRNIRQGRLHTIISSAFSHQSLWHFTANMVSFETYVRSALKFGIDPVGLTVLALGSALSGSVATLYDWRQKGIVYGSALGASGLVWGLGSAVTLLRPNTMVMWHPFPKPMPLWMFTLGTFSYEVFSLQSNPQSRVGHAAHLGGAAFGAVFYLLWPKRGSGLHK